MVINALGMQANLHIQSFWFHRVLIVLISQVYVSNFIVFTPNSSEIVNMYQKIHKKHVNCEKNYICAYLISNN